MAHDIAGNNGVDAIEHKCAELVDALQMVHALGATIDGYPETLMSMFCGSPHRQRANVKCIVKDDVVN